MPFVKGDPRINRKGRPRKERPLDTAQEELKATPEVPEVNEFVQWVQKNEFTRARYFIAINWISSWVVIEKLIQHGVIIRHEDESLEWTLNRESLVDLFYKWPWGKQFSRVKWGPLETAFKLKRHSLRFYVSKNGGSRYYQDGEVNARVCGVAPACFLHREPEAEPLHCIAYHPDSREGPQGRHDRDGFTGDISHAIKAPAALYPRHDFESRRVRRVLRFRDYEGPYPGRAVGDQPGQRLGAASEGRTGGFDFHRSGLDDCPRLDKSIMAGNIPADPVGYLANNRFVHFRISFSLSLYYIIYSYN
jgi:hypothetical protein